MNRLAGLKKPDLTALTSSLGPYRFEGKEPVEVSADPIDLVRGKVIGSEGKGVHVCT